MLPTTGHFRDISCPYYENSCDRPYCHFRHPKKTQEPTETATTVSSEVPTYNPTPKSQLVNVRNHIPISYVPDLGTRSNRSSFRTKLPSYAFADKQPTYNPTPLSILSKSGDTNSSLVSQTKPVLLHNENSATSCKAVSGSPDITAHMSDDSNDINLEDLSVEFKLIDEILTDSGTVQQDNGKQDNVAIKVQRDIELEETHITDKSSSTINTLEVSKSSLPTEQDKSKHSSGVKTKSKSHNDKKYNGKVKDSHDKIKSSSKKISDTHNSKKENKKHDSKHGKSKSDIKTKRSESKSSTSSSKRKIEDSKSDQSAKKERKENKEKHISKHKHSCSSNKEESKESSSSRDKNKSNSDLKSNKKRKERDKKHSKEKDKHSKNNDKYETKSKEGNSNVGNLKPKLQQPIKINTVDNLFEDGSDRSETFSNNGGDIDLEDSDLEEECYRIFNEYKPTEPEIPIEYLKEETVIEDNVEIKGRKRVAHGNVENTIPKISYNKPKALPSPAQIMSQRLKLAQLMQANKEQENILAEMQRQVLKHRLEITEKKTEERKLPKLKSGIISKTKTTKQVEAAPQPSTSSSTSSYSLVDDILNNKATKPRRIAPVMNVNSIQRAKEKIQEMAKMKAKASLTKTPSQTQVKASSRVAHVPEYTIQNLPEVLEADKSKLPITVRSRFLKMLADECYKLYICKDDAHERALREEFKCYERCGVLITYKNSVMLAVNRVRKERQERDASGLGPMLSGETVISTKDEGSELKGRKLYENITKYILTEEELALHGFPREGQTPGRATIKPLKPKVKYNLDDDERVCCRCSMHYKVDEEGFPLYEEECLYHPLRKRTFRGESFYLCCRSSEATGCVTSTTHVSDGKDSDDGEYDGYQVIKSPEFEGDPRSYTVYALDCEMCYTTKGLELTRVTVVNSDCKTVYETLVKPLNPIVDYNTRFSGITKEQMDRTATSILQVQANILHLCNSETILIGHSLESDMKALKIVHSCIIDTSVMFPHKFGLPHKRALRALASDYLRKIIQNDVSGHDSAEDALTCMELVIWKVKEEMKSRGVKV